MQPSRTHAGARFRRVRIGGFTVAVAALGLLLWARLILVTGHPRTAIARPEPAAKAPASKAPTAPAPTAPAPR